MDVIEMPAEVEELLARFESVADDFQALNLTPHGDPVLLEMTRRLEQVKRRLEPVDHALVIEIEERKLPFANGCRTPAQFLRQLLQITPGEARARFAAAKALATTHRLNGEAVEPIYPTVAAAVAAGELSARHAQVIVTMIEQLPDEVRAVKDRAVEEYLVGYACEHDPDALGVLARDLGRALDQDGQYNELAHRDKTRGLTVHRHADGSSRIEGNLTAECTEHVLTHLDALAAPKPAADGTPDPRTATQRRHDALLAMLKLVMRAELLPQVAGVTATILLHLDVDAYGTGQGTATTGHGYTIPADIAKQWAGPEARAILTLLSKAKGIEAYSSTQRFFTEQQRLVMFTRDSGCSFPGCDAPALWTEAHHATDYQITGHTRVDDGTPLCGYHHDHHEAMGWTLQMTNGRPWWKPPKHIDPDQTPRRNQMHNRGPDSGTRCP